jgi:organic hydroperoxide reductase OsmC/OhrA
MTTMDERHFTVTLSRDEGYEFRARFDDESFAEILLDEPPPLGAGHGPNAARVLGAAVGNCLAASLLFCLAKARVDVGDLTATVTGTVARNEKGRLRITGIRVVLSPAVRPADRERITRCLDLFEDFCLVTASVRAGLNVQVEVMPVDRA